MRLNTSNSYITNRTDTPAPRRIAPLITKWLYFLVLIFIVVYLIYYFTNRAISIEHHALLDINSTPIKTPHAGLVTEIAPVGSIVTSGQRIALVKSLKECEMPDNSVAIERISYQIADKKNDIFAVEKTYTLKQGQLSQIKKNQLDRALELNAPLINENFKAGLTEDIALLGIELATERRKLELLTERLRQITQKPQPKLPPSCFDQEILSNQSGVVVAASVELNSAVKVGDDLIHIEPTDPAMVVRAFVNYKESASIEVGQEFIVEFANGERSSAKVIGLVNSKNEWLSARSKDFETSRATEITFEPTNNDAKSVWKKNKHLQVKVIGRKI